MRLHKHKRTPTESAHERFYVEPFVKDVARIARHAAADSADFVVETASGAFEWRTLPRTHEKVARLIACSAQTAAQQPIPVMSFDSWVAGGELYDSDGALSDSDDDVHTSE